MTLLRGCPLGGRGVSQGECLSEWGLSDDCMAANNLLRYRGIAWALDEICTLTNDALVKEKEREKDGLCETVI